MKPQTVLILGGGIGGIVAANSLRRKLAKEHRIIIVDKKADFHFTPSYLWVITGERNLGQISRSLTVLSRKGIEFLQEEVKHLDPKNKLVQTDKKELIYDYLIIALGADLIPKNIRGYSSETMYNLYSISALPKIREALLNMKSGSLTILIASSPFKCPAAPYEAALLTDDLLKKNGTRDSVSISIYTPESLPMLTAGPAMGNAVKQMVETRGIKFNSEHKVAGIDSKEKTISFENQKTASFDLLLIVPPHKAPKAIDSSGLSSEKGWIPVDRETLKTSYENVYAIGDITAIKLPSGAMLPKAGVFAEYQALVVAENIAAELSGGKATKSYGGTGACFLELGHGKAGYATGNFYAEPAPEVRLKKAGRLWHWGKILFEKYWLWRWL